jgi:enoyl-CoA hydratase/carnithine racemase
MSINVIIIDQGPVRLIRMNRPDKKNALTSAMYDGMAQAIESAERRLTDPLHRDRRRTRRLLGRQRSGRLHEGRDRRRGARQFGAALSSIRWRVPNGRWSPPCRAWPVGIGTTMMLHCDYAVAASDARFSTPFVALGLVPEAAVELLAPRLMGHRRAFELLVMGKPLSGEEAKACGLVNQVAPADQVEAEAVKAAQAIAALPLEGVAISRA